MAEKTLQNDSVGREEIFFPRELAHGVNNWGLRLSRLQGLLLGWGLRQGWISRKGQSQSCSMWMFIYYIHMLWSIAAPLKDTWEKQLFLWLLNQIQQSQSKQFYQCSVDFLFGTEWLFKFYVLFLHSGYVIRLEEEVRFVISVYLLACCVFIFQ